MRYLLLALIEFYWKIVPKYRQERCIFRQPCSKYLSKKTRNEGFVEGIKAIKYRYRNCRPGFSLLTNPVTGELNMLLPNDDIVEEKNIAKYLIRNKKVTYTSESV
ncbi:membrane protein insertion efficiency factor YidD [Christiangramia salexigens]|uniref:Membrane protein insertion efficiency factor YidD n=1 Tax=Christiangramia salexigens TaxID=1913577 RepID=A0A1L3J684_9FLAO|nr:membrane protein insertion efficiency factor YidD [Christiangramia salexigens]APG60641.1 hypothetical protein LPB144_09605 [Christiangramia salexigens]